MDDKPKTVSMRATQAHTYDGIARNPGDVYEVEEQYVDSVQNVLKWVEPVTPAKKAPPKAEVKGAAGSTAVKPLGTEAFTEPATQHKPTK